MATETSNVGDQANNNNNTDNEKGDQITKVEKQSQENDGAEPQQAEASQSSNDVDVKPEVANREGDINGKSEQDEDDDDDDDDDDGDEEEDDDDQDEGDNGDTALNDESTDDTEKTNLIVNYLPQNMTDEEFKDLFTKFGEMKSCKIVRNRMTGYSYGFGFVDFATHEQAIKAIDELNGHELDTKKIKVAFARPAGQDIKQANLYVKNIPLNWTQDDVRKAFESHGNIIQVRVLGNNRGVAFVLYDLRKQAEMALEAMQGKKIEGSDEPLEIKFAADKKSDKKRSRRGGGSGRSGTGTNSDSINGRTRERGNRGGAGRNRNRSQSDSRHRSQPRGQRGTSNQRGGNIRQNNNYNNSNNGFGPVRQQTSVRMNRFQPFAPVHQQAQIQQANPMQAYGYPQQPMYPYMMPQQQAMMQFNSAVATGQPMGAAPIGAMGAYQMAPQMSQMGYAAPAAATQASLTNMYSIASNTMQNAAQMQPQLGQPMSNQTRGQQSSNAGASSGAAANDGVTLFVYNIGPNSDESELQSMFAPYGQVLRCNVVRKTPGGETKGFGFVTLKDRNQANAAISSLNGTPRNGKTLQVSFKK